MLSEWHSIAPDAAICAGISSPLFDRSTWLLPAAEDTVDIKRIYYTVKPFIPRSVQITLRRKVIQRQREKCGAVWPIHPDSAAPPPSWTGWPEGKQFSVVLTHDVELAVGQSRCEWLMQLEQEAGFVSSFNFVPERYADRPEVRNLLTYNGFEVGVHGLNHDGKLYASREEFASRAERINGYIKEWNATGFRSPAMHHNLDWIRDLNIEYDASTFDTDPFEPQPDAACTIFPFYVPADGDRSGYVELPYTLAQDFTLFVLLEEQSIDVWKKKVDWVASKGGMVLVNVHPDYMHFGSGTPPLGEFKAQLYTELLEYIRDTYAGQYWHALPRDIARFWKSTASCKRQIAEYSITDQMNAPISS